MKDIITVIIIILLAVTDLNAQNFFSTPITLLDGHIDRLGRCIIQAPDDIMISKTRYKLNISDGLSFIKHFGSLFVHTRRGVWLPAGKKFYLVASRFTQEQFGHVHLDIIKI